MNTTVRLGQHNKMRRTHLGGAHFVKYNKGPRLHKHSKGQISAEPGKNIKKEREEEAVGGEGRGRKEGGGGELPSLLGVVHLMAEILQSV